MITESFQKKTPPSVIYEEMKKYESDLKATIHDTQDVVYFKGHERKFVYKIIFLINVF